MKTTIMFEAECFGDVVLWTTFHRFQGPAMQQANRKLADGYESRVYRCAVEAPSKRQDLVLAALEGRTVVTHKRLALVYGHIDEEPASHWSDTAPIVVVESYLLEYGPRVDRVNMTDAGIRAAVRELARELSEVPRG